MIQINNLTYSYGSKKGNVLEGVTLRMKEGEIYGLLGKNGAGKSTLINIITGQLLTIGGGVRVLGQDASAREVAALSEMFLVPDEINLPNVKLSKFIKLFSCFYPRYSEEIMTECLKDFEIEGDQRMMKMSLGERKKAYIAFAFATQTRLLIMDEPTNGLDIPSKTQFRRLVSRYMQDDRTIVISTHQIHDVGQIVDHIVILDKHKVALDESIGDIAEKYTFGQETVTGESDGVIYSEPSAGGETVIRHRRDGETETNIDIELLFNAIISGVKL